MGIFDYSGQKIYKIIHSPFKIKIGENYKELVGWFYPVESGNNKYSEKIFFLAAIVIASCPFLKISE